MTIPKVLFQTSLCKPPVYLIERIKTFCPGWEYKHFLDADIIQFITENPLEDFTNSLAVFHSFKFGAHKSDFFRYYYLYVNGGVYLDSDAVLESDLDSIIEDYSFITVNSGLDKIHEMEKSIFNGFICAAPKNKIIYQALKEIYYMDVEILNKHYFLNCKNLYKIVYNYNKIFDEISEKADKPMKKEIKILEEEIIDDKSAVSKDHGKIVLSHHFAKDFLIPSLIPIKEKTLKPVNEMKIGITFDIPLNIHSLFSNGIRQNVLYLTELFCNIGYETHLIVKDENISLIETSNHLANASKMSDKEKLKDIIYYDTFNITRNSEILSADFDIVIIFGYDLPIITIETLKYMNTKILKYLCGNSYFIDSEKILYNQHKSDYKEINYVRKKDNKLYDQLWVIPQMVNTNKHYFQTMYRTESIEVPFIWSNKSILLTCLSENVKEEKDLIYKNKGSLEKKIAVFEPNISLMKWCLPALLVCENSYRKNQNIDRVYLTNISHQSKNINDFNIDGLNAIVKNLDLYTDKKVFVESRYNSISFMGKHADIAVSHQMENPLNYLYFDLAWMGWPIVHNAHLCKDVGYYYDGFDYEMGGKVLSDVILNHDKQADEYLEKNRKILDRYLPSNVELQEKYKQLICNLYYTVRKEK